MKPQSIAQLAVVAAIFAGAGALGSAVSVGVGGNPLQVTPFLGAVFVLLAIVLLWAGLAVRRLRQHKRTWMTPLMAVRTAVAARAGSLMGAASLGVLVGVAVVGSVRLEASAMASSAATAALGALGALVLTVVAVIVERWCVIHPDDDDRGDHADGDASRRLPGTPA